MKKLKTAGALLLAIAWMSATVVIAQTETPQTSKQEKAAPSSMTVKCTKGGCCGGTMLCCGNKASTLQKALEGIQGVSKVEVNKETAEATLEYTGEVTEVDLNKAVKKDGFEVRKIAAKK